MTTHEIATYQDLHHRMLLAARALFTQWRAAFPEFYDWWSPRGWDGQMGEITFTDRYVCFTLRRDVDDALYLTLDLHALVDPQASITKARLEVPS